MAIVIKKTFSIYLVLALVLTTTLAGYLNMPSKAEAAFTFVNSGQNGDSASNATLAATVTGVHAGDLVVILAKWESGDTTVSASDGTSSFTDALVGNHAVGTANGGTEPNVTALYLLSSVTSGSVTYTVTWGASKPFRDMVVAVYTPSSGTLSLDGTPNKNVGSGTSLTTGNITTSGTDGIAFAFYGEYGTGLNTEQIDSLAADRTVLGGSANQSEIWIKSYTSGFTGQGTAGLNASNNWAAAILAFKLTADGGGGSSSNPHVTARGGGSTGNDSSGCNPSTDLCTNTYSTPGYTTFTADRDLTAYISCWGGGGGGGDGGTAGGGAGGGGGAYASSTTSISSGSTIRFFVGAGGSGGGAGAPGSNGATSTASTTAPITIVSAAPGWGGAINNGAGGLGGATASSTGTTLSNGGKGGNGDNNGTSQDTGGGGGGAGGPNGDGGGGAIGQATTGGGGGGGNGGATATTVTGGTSTNGGAGGNGGNGGTSPTGYGKAGTDHAFGAGGGGGGDNGLAGGQGGAVGGGGGGGEVGAAAGGNGKCLMYYKATTQSVGGGSSNPFVRIRGGSGGGGGGSVSYVQSNSNVDSFTNISATFTSGVTAGSVIAVGVSWVDTSATLSNITDNCNTGGTSNTYTLVDNPTTGDNSRSAMAYAVIGATTGSCTVATTLSATNFYQAIVIHEISGVDTSSPLDQHKMTYQVDPGIGTDAVTTGNVTTTSNGEYIFGVSFADEYVFQTLTEGTGFNPRQSGNGTIPFASEDKIQSSAGSVAATFTTSDGVRDQINGIMTFKAASGGGASGNVKFR